MCAKFLKVSNSKAYISLPMLVNKQELFEGTTCFNKIPWDPTFASESFPSWVRRLLSSNRRHVAAAMTSGKGFSSTISESPFLIPVEDNVFPVADRSSGFGGNPISTFKPSAGMRVISEIFDFSVPTVSSADKISTTCWPLLVFTFNTKPPILSC